jgi:hypothetical protein
MPTAACMGKGYVTDRIGLRFTKDGIEPVFPVVNTKKRLLHFRHGILLHNKREKFFIICINFALIESL